MGGEGKRGEGIGGIGTPPPGTGMEGRERREGWGGGGEGRGGEGEEISIHGLKLVAPPMHKVQTKIKNKEETLFAK